MSPARSLAVAGAALVLLTAAGLALHDPGEIEIGDERLSLWVGVTCVAGVVYAIAVWTQQHHALPRRTIWLVLGVASVVRLMAVAGPVTLSSDIFRYVWDGRTQIAGINPYRYVPDAPELAFLRQPGMFENTNRRGVPTAYAPVAQMIFAAIAAVSPGLFSTKLAMTLLEALGIGIMVYLLGLAGLPRTQVLVYAWNPMPVWEYASNGHVDAAAIAFIALALLAAVRLRPAWAGVALAMAALCKFLPAALLPVLWRPASWRPASLLRREWRLPLAFALTVVACYAVYASAGLGVFGFLSGYTAEEGLSNGGGVFWLRALAAVAPLPHGAGTVYLALMVAGLAALAVWILQHPLPLDPALRVRTLGRDALLLSTATTAIITPHYAWYFGWLAFLACLCPAPSMIYLTASSVLLYMDPGHNRVIWPTLVFVPFAAIAVRDLARRAACPQPS